MKNYSVSVCGWSFFLIALLGTTNAGILPTINPAVLDPSALLRASAVAASLDEAFLRFTTLVTSGVYVPIPNNGTVLNSTLLTVGPGPIQIKAGALALPTDFLCAQKGLIENVVCRICSADCTYVHNKFGGSCGVMDPSVALPNTSQSRGPVCICNDEKRGNVTDITDFNAQCGQLIQKDTVDVAFDLAVAVFLRTRMEALQCIPDPLQPNGYNNAGCNVDCIENHNYRNGTCVNNTPTATFVGETRVGFNCGCFYDNNMSLTYPPPTTA